MSCGDTRLFIILLNHNEEYRLEGVKHAESVLNPTQTANLSVSQSLHTGSLLNSFCRAALGVQAVRFGSWDTNTPSSAWSQVEADRSKGRQTWQHHFGDKAIGLRNSCSPLPQGKQQREGTVRSPWRGTKGRTFVSRQLRNKIKIQFMG